MVVRVLHLRSSAGFYGAERVIVTLMKRSPGDHIETTLACIENYISGDQSLLNRAQQAGLKALEIPCKSRMDFRTINHLVTVCKENQIDIIHSHDYKSHFYGLIASKFAGCKQVATLHGKTLGNVKNRVFELVENLLLHMVSHITVVSEPLFNSLSGSGLSKKLSQIANGVDDHSFNPDIKGFGKNYWGFDSSSFVFGTIGRMSEEKGHRLLIEAFSKLSVKNGKARLLLIGNGPLYEDLVELSQSLGLGSKVKFAGSRTEVERILNDMDCYVSPSHTEGMPMSILEAMATGLPIVATEVGSVGHLLRDDHGKLLQPGNIDELARQMQSVLDGINFMKEAGKKCRTRVEKEFSAGIQSREFANVYRSVLKNPESD